MASPALTVATPITVDNALLRSWPLPDPGHATDKDARGRLLLIGGSVEMPGGIILAALGAMRAGAGKLCVATGRSVASLVAQALPEARVIGLEETSDGGLVATPANLPLEHVDAILIGPGMQDEAAACTISRMVLTSAPRAPAVLDAIAMECLAHDGWDGLIAHRRTASELLQTSVVITPHAGEMASLLHIAKDEVEGDKQQAAVTAAARWQTLVVAKGAVTHIATPSGQLWSHSGGSVGLATSGSGDVLAGVITGLLSRGATLEQASIWAVRLHALAGEKLELDFGRLGYLAREIPARIPALMNVLSTSTT